MRRKLRFASYAFCLSSLLSVGQSAKAQCSFTSTTTGGTVNISLFPLAVAAPSSCPFGYNYNITYQYNVTFSGTVQLYTLQAYTSCTGDPNIYVPLVSAGTYISTAVSGSRTTTANIYRGASDCNTATPASLGCLDFNPKIFIEGNGIPTQTVTTCPFTQQTILPVHLVSFDAAIASNQVNLAWVTATEVSNKKFELMRSTDLANWNAIYEVAGSASSSQAKKYAYSDKMPAAGTAYYRLKQTDVDGTIMYSRIIAVNAVKPDASVRVSSNPGNGAALQVSGLAIPDQWKVTTSDVTGKPVYQAAIVSNKVSLPESLPAGVYILQFNNKVTGERKITKYQKL